jgi:acyl-CoA thioester hydrolase
MPQSAFKTSYRIAWADTDAAQVVHYSNYFKFFERAEEEFYRHLGFSFTEIGGKGLWFPRVEAFCQYKKPAKFNDLLDVELVIGELREKSVKYEFRIFNKKTSDLLAVGYIIAVAADRQKGKATDIPEEILGKLRPFSK